MARCLRARIGLLMLPIALSIICSRVSAQTVWSGLTFDFTKNIVTLKSEAELSRACKSLHSPNPALDDHLRFSAPLHVVLN